MPADGLQTEGVIAALGRHDLSGHRIGVQLVAAAFMKA
jgi:hypothetical protein